MSYNKPPFKEPFIEDSEKRVRVLFGGKFVVDTCKSKLVWEKPFYPIYFFSASDLSSSLLRKSEQSQNEEGTTVYDLVVGDREAKGAVTEFTGQGKHKELAGLIRVNFASADAWFEEDDRIYGHPKDPYKRVDVLRSSRHVRIEVNGVEVANTHRPFLLYETGLRRRTYIPLTDVRLDLLKPSDTTSLCPYKGWANYYNVHLPNGEIHKDIVWFYRTPNAECIQIIGLAAFYDEKVDVWVDGEKQG
ncbi:hypothetical protein HYDPIDRAFT_108924 [Hydnomerulius pinastri MD-312]|nr:hypothetical protein HYDPIDRAFT_108924 [Hydnomerulius pinastri MD-312]